MTSGSGGAETNRRTGPRSWCREPIYTAPTVISPARIAPSILAADLARLADEVAAVEPHVDLLHIDVMDGHFVPNISLGVPVVESLRKASSLVFDCHLMTTNPAAFLGEFSTAGADLVTMHIEAVPDPTAAAGEARSLGLGFGLVLNPATPFEAVEPFVELCDMLLIMSVVPGFGGQAFMSQALGKISEARNWVDSRGLATDIQVDGGITPATAGAARRAGADVFVAGSAIFRAPDPVAAVSELRAAIEAAG